MLKDWVDFLKEIYMKKNSKNIKKKSKYRPIVTKKIFYCKKIPLHRDLLRKKFSKLLEVTRRFVPGPTS